MNPSVEIKPPSRRRLILVNLGIHALRLALGAVQYGGGIFLGLWAAHACHFLP